MNIKVTKYINLFIVYVALPVLIIGVIVINYKLKVVAELLVDTNYLYHKSVQLSDQQKIVIENLKEKLIQIDTWSEYSLNGSELVVTNSGQYSPIYKLIEEQGSKIVFRMKESYCDLCTQRYFIRLNYVVKKIGISKSDVIILVDKKERAGFDERFDIKEFTVYYLDEGFQIDKNRIDCPYMFVINTDMICNNFTYLPDQDLNAINYFFDKNVSNI